jgi:hypothetical protein
MEAKEPKGIDSLKGDGGTFSAISINKLKEARKWLRYPT